MRLEHYSLLFFWRYLPYDYCFFFKLCGRLFSRQCEAWRLSQQKAVTPDKHHKNSIHIKAVNTGRANTKSRWTFLNVLRVLNISTTSETAEPYNSIKVNLWKKNKNIFTIKYELIWWYFRALEKCKTVDFKWNHINTHMHLLSYNPIFECKLVGHLEKIEIISCSRQQPLLNRW